MEKRLLKKLNYLYEEDEFYRIVERILEIPEEERDYDLVSHLARAYNNLDCFGEAIEQLFLIKNQGNDDSLWHHRLGYAYFYLENYVDALKEFEIAYNLNNNDNLIKMFLEMTKIELFMKNNHVEEINS